MEEVALIFGLLNLFNNLNGLRIPTARRPSPKATRNEMISSRESKSAKAEPALTVRKL